MRITNQNNVAYFGDKSDDLQGNGAYVMHHFESLADKLKLDQLFFLKQTHSDHVYYLEENPPQKINTFLYEGDAIITKLQGIGIGVVTADCLPVLIMDTKNAAIAAIHAGWRGFSLNIITKTISQMNRCFNSQLADLKVFLGPSAEDCCYEVQNDLLEKFDAPLIELGIVKNQQAKLYFSAKRAALYELKKLGIFESQINSDAHFCTICHDHYCSYRRDKTLAGRMPSVIWIK